MKNIKIIYSYDGSKFYGLQRQEKYKTVQGEIEKVLLKAFNISTNLISSGRTDANVHAINQVSNFIIHKDIPLEAIKIQLNRHLFGEVKIHTIQEVDINFNSRYDAKIREYEYIFTEEDNITPFNFLYVSSINKKQKLDINILKSKLQLFVGTHNFYSYSKTDSDSKNPVREIKEIKIKKLDKLYYVNILGSGFLKSMIRLILASAIYEDEETIIYRLNNPYNKLPKKILSPHGLYLKNIYYEVKDDN